MMMFFTLADTGERENLPLITIPARSRQLILHAGECWRRCTDRGGIRRAKERRDLRASFIRTNALNHNPLPIFFRGASR